MEQVNNEGPFFIKGQRGLDELAEYLQATNYNQYKYLRDDKKGNPMYALSYNDGKSQFPHKRGLVIIIGDVVAQAEELMQQNVKG